MIIIKNCDSLINHLPIKKVNQIHLKNYDNSEILQSEILLSNFGHYYLVNIAEHHIYYHYFKSLEIDNDSLVQEVVDHYNQQQEQIKVLATKLDYYLPYLGSWILLKYLYLTVEPTFNHKTLTANSYQIVKSDITNNTQTIFLEKTDNIGGLASLISFYYYFKNLKYNLQTVQNSKPGLLNFIDFDFGFDFEVKRLFTLTDFDQATGNDVRGLHYNLNFDEIIVINNGKIEFEITNQAGQKIYFDLGKNDILYFPRNYWLCFKILDSSTNITVLCNQTFVDSVSCYDFKQFLAS